MAIATSAASMTTTLMMVGPGAAAYCKLADLKTLSPDLTGGAGNVLWLLLVQLFAFATALRRGQDPDASAPDT